MVENCTGLRAVNAGRRVEYNDAQRKSRGWRQRREYREYNGHHIPEERACSK
jgi:hypothetical protein